jgi:uncharacterized membrane protein
MGIIYAFLSAFFATSKDVVSKKIAFSTDGTVSAAASFIYALPYYILLLGFLSLIGEEDFAFSWMFLLWVFARAVADSIAEWAKMTAFTHGDISVVSCYLSMSPVFLLLLSPVVTGDPLTLLTIIGVALVVIGALLVSFDLRERSVTASAGAIKYGLLASFFFALNSCFDRLAVQIASPTLSGFAMTLVAGLFLLPSVLKNAERKNNFVAQHRPFLLRGFFEITFMVLKLAALKHLTAPAVIGIQKSALLFNIGAGSLVFKEKGILNKMVAGLFIVVGVVVILFEVSR